MVGESYYANLTDCYADVKVSGYDAGGVVGSATNKSMSNCYASGTVSGTRAGGVAGYLYDTKIYNSFSMCTKVYGSSCVGAVVGQLAWTASGSNCHGMVGTTVSGGSNLVTGTSSMLDPAYIMSLEFAARLGWSSDVWYFCDGYVPVLRHQLNE